MGRLRCPAPSTVSTATGTNGQGDVRTLRNAASISMMSNASRVRDVYALLCAEVPDGTVSRRDLLRSAHALVALAQGPVPQEDDRNERTCAPTQWPVDVIWRRHGWLLVSYMQRTGHGSFEDHDRRQGAAFAEARRLMEYGL